MLALLDYAQHPRRMKLLVQLAWVRDAIALSADAGSSFSVRKSLGLMWRGSAHNALKAVAIGQ